MNDTLSNICGCGIILLSGVVIGFGLGSGVYKDEAVKHNAAYYHPVTTKFTWQTNLQSPTIFSAPK